MSALRQAAQQALEAMRCAVPTGKITLADWYKSITALRAALAEPVQERAVCDECGKHKRDGWALYCVGCVEPMFARPPRIKELELERQMALNALVMMRDKYGEYACPACDHADAAIKALRDQT